MIEWLRGLGFSPDTRMDAKVDEYRGWLKADNDFYSYKRRKGSRVMEYSRMTLHPFWLVANEWASLMLPEMDITSTDETMSALIAERFDGFGIDQADFVARAFALGTGAFAVSLRNVSDDGRQNPGAIIDVETYGASDIAPLTWSSDGTCTQCAFSSLAEIDGRQYEQCQAHIVVDGTYHIVTQLFDIKKRKPVSIDSVVYDFDTRSDVPTFALIRPAVPNMHVTACAMGASVADRAIDAVKAVDEAFSTFVKHVRMCSPKIFIDDSMIEKVTRVNSHGDKVTTYSAFGEADDMVFRLRPGGDGASMMQVVQPEMRIEENAQAINTALKLLSQQSGFGTAYFSWDAHQGIRTATEVASDNSALARNLKKHQGAIAPAIAGIVRAVAGIARNVCGVAVDPSAPVSVTFGDSIITDNESDKAADLAELAALNLPALKVRYLMKWHGMTEEEALAAVPIVVDEFEL